MHPRHPQALRAVTLLSCRWGWRAEEVLPEVEDRAIIYQLGLALTVYEINTHTE